MRKFPSVEDYIEIINGDRDAVTGRLYGLFDSRPPIVSLARYDVKIIDSMSQATQSGRSLTDKQADLAVKIVLKYRKQLERQEIDVSPVESPSFRLGIRQIDRRKLLHIVDNNIVLQFPYDTALINDIRELAKISQGRWRFDSDNKAWYLAITETNVVAAYGFAQNNQFEIAPEFHQYLQAVESCEQVPYSIMLVQQQDQLAITNAAATLTQAIENWCGFDLSNLDLLVDAAPEYLYSVDQAIQQDVAARHGPRVLNLMLAKETKFAPSSDLEVFNDVVRYATITGRYPIYVYEPDLSDKMYGNFVLRCFDSQQVHRVNVLKPAVLSADIKVIYFNKYSAGWDQPIPLLISGHGMMHGGEKTVLLQQARKTVYFATEVYKNKC